MALVYYPPPLAQRLLLISTPDKYHPGGGIDWARMKGRPDRNQTSTAIRREVLTVKHELKALSCMPIRGYTVAPAVN